MVWCVSCLVAPALRAPACPGSHVSSQTGLVALALPFLETHRLLPSGLFLSLLLLLSDQLP